MFNNDITMCLTEDCDKREECWRYKATPDRLQSYSDFTQLCKEHDYEYFYPVEVDK